MSNENKTGLIDYRSKINTQAKGLQKIADPSTNTAQNSSRKITNQERMRSAAVKYLRAYATT